MRLFLPRFITHGCLVVLTALTLAACGGGDDDSNSAANSSPAPASVLAASAELGNAFAASLSGAQETPPVTTAAQGSGTVVFNASTREITATVTTVNIVGTAAHIHQAPPGTAGPIVFPLSETGAGSGIWTTKVTLTEQQATTLRAGDFYFNVHSAAFPNGEIRGQIVPQARDTATGTGSGTPSAGTDNGVPTSLFSTANFLAALRGSQEVPPTASPAQGAGTVVIDPVSRQLIAAVTTTGIVATDAHIHEGAPGVSGPIIVPLTASAPGSGVWLAKATLTDAQYNALRAGNLYFNVHSAAFPNGEIRGQILPQQIFIDNLIEANRTGDFTGISGPINNKWPNPASSTTGMTGAGVVDPNAVSSTTGTVRIPGSGSTGMIGGMSNATGSSATGTGSNIGAGIR